MYAYKYVCKMTFSSGVVNSCGDKCSSKVCVKKILVSPLTSCCMCNIFISTRHMVLSMGPSYCERYSVRSLHNCLNASWL